MISIIILCALCLLINTTNAQMTGYCGNTYTGYTTYSGDIRNYTVYLASYYDSITVSSCYSSYDTKVWIFSSSGLTTYAYCDDGSGDTTCNSCGTNNEQMTYDPYSSGTYYKVGIGGYGSHYGYYSISITCNDGYPTPSPTVCPSYDYECNDGDCIPTSWVCDDVDDCSDGDDEDNCGSTTVSSGGAIGGSVAAVLVIVGICILVFACNRRRRIYGNQYKAGLLANQGAVAVGPARPKVIVANPKPQPVGVQPQPQGAQMGFVTVSQVTVSRQPMPQQRVVTNAQGQRIVYATQPATQGQQPIIMRPAGGPVPMQPTPQTQGAPVVVKAPVTMQGQQPKIVYVQAPQQLGPNGQPVRAAPVYVQPVQSGQAAPPVQNQMQPQVQVQAQPAPVVMGNGVGGVQSQPGGPGLDGMEAEEKAPPPAFADPNALEPPPQYQKQSSEGVNKSGDDAPPPYMDLNPSAPGLSLSAAEAQDLQQFLRLNQLDAHDASLREAGAETLDDLKDLNTDEIKQVAVDAGMDETDQKMFMDACMKLKQ